LKLFENVTGVSFF